MSCIAYDPVLGVFTDSFETPGVSPCHMKPKMFSEAGQESTLRKVWGLMQTGMFAGLIPMVLNLADAKELAARAKAEKWSPGKCISEVRKAAHTAKKAPRLLGTVSGCLSGIVAGTEAGVMAAAAGATAGGVALVGAAAFAIALVLGALFSWTIGAIFAKRGFIRIVEGYLGKKLMNDVNNGSDAEYAEEDEEKKKQ